MNENSVYDRVAKIVNRCRMLDPISHEEDVRNAYSILLPTIRNKRTTRIVPECTDEAGSFYWFRCLGYRHDAIFCESDFLLCSRSNSPGSSQEIFLKGWYLEVPLVQGLVRVLAGAGVLMVITSMTRPFPREVRTIGGGGTQCPTINILPGEAIARLLIRVLAVTPEGSKPK
ncbi:hypothetical protein AVEN_102340-1 [Araneus ventricosus]|uniref:Uncharacterized protein n=1 Tax=Araneus ventricosus TaxID=182803 RepID=A0A4Y2PRD5_ARAVE|nr:hypothetical protein AVEN_102340-1 [Araneus ventricosus]